MTRCTRVSALATSLAVVGLIVAIPDRASTQAPATTYTVLDIGTLGGATTARGASDDTYAIVGSAATSAGTVPFTRSWYAGITPLATLGGASGDAYAATSNLAVGRSQLANGRYHATMWEDGRPVDLGTLGGTHSVAYALNNWGVIVGSSDTLGGAGAFLWDSRGTRAMAPINVDFGGTRSTAYGISDSGLVVGTASLPGNTVSHAFSWVGGIATDLGSPGGTSVALSVNENDEIVGYWQSTNGERTSAFVHRNGAMQTLPSLGGAVTRAIWITADGVIGGDADTPGGVRHAVLWRDGAIIDLNTRIPAGSGWVLQAADFVSRYGHIVGYGTKGGQRRSFVLLPPIDFQIRVDSVSDLDTNRPVPIEAGRSLDLGFEVLADTATAASGQVVVDRLSGPIEYVSWQSNAAQCTKSGQTLTCRVPGASGPVASGFWVIIRARTTGTGPFTHTATVRADQFDPDVSNNTATQFNSAISLEELTGATPVVGGTPALSRATLTAPTSSGGSRVRLSSSNPAVASVPTEFDVLPWSNGGLWREFYVTTRPVSAVTDVQISATFGLVTRTQTLRILPFPPTPWGGSTRPVPGQIEAEDYDVGGLNIAYYDTTPGNAGGLYRSNSVDIAAASDAGGGYTLGWIVAGEWLTYSVDVGTAGDYEVQARVASRGLGGTFHVEAKEGNATSPIVIPDTGGWQSWRTVSAPLHLASGPQGLRVVFDTNGASGRTGNLNWVRVVRAGSQSTPFSGTPLTLPGTIQAEQFDAGGAAVAYHDTTTGNLGGEYRSTQVDIQATTDGGGGFLVGWTQAAEWLQYTVNVPMSGAYDLSARVASKGAGGTFHVEFGGVDVTGPIVVPSTGGWQHFTTLTRRVTLSAGTQVMRVVCDVNGVTGGIGNLNSFSVVPQSVEDGGATTEP